MSTSYVRCDEDVYEMLHELITEYRFDLVDCEATIALYFAANDKGHAMKARGHQVLGKCKINNLVDRAQGKTDVTIFLDMDWWKDASSRRQRALLHHELSHVEVYDPEDGTDDLDRPVLKSRYGDWDNDGFYQLAKLYGEDSCERINLAIVQEALNQMEMFGDEPTIPMDQPEAEQPKRKKVKA